MQEFIASSIRIKLKTQLAQLKCHLHNNPSRSTKEEINNVIKTNTLLNPFLCYLKSPSLEEVSWCCWACYCHEISADGAPRLASGYFINAVLSQQSAISCYATFLFSLGALCWSSAMPSALPDELQIGTGSNNPETTPW